MPVNEGSEVSPYDCIVVGGGFTGLAAALELSREGKRVAVVEKDLNPGGLAGVFSFSNGVELEKFYHHFFLSDSYIIELITSVGLGESLRTVPSRTGTFYNGQVWRLSTPLDLLRFSALSLLDRTRLGMAVLRARAVRDHREIEHLSIREWLEPQVGARAFDIVWAPLLESKFGEFSGEVSAAWMWKKLVLRGGSRGSSGSEKLAFLEGGFSEIIARLVTVLTENGVDLFLGAEVASLTQKGEAIVSATTTSGLKLSAKSFLLTVPQPVARRLLEAGYSTNENLSPEIPHLANVCLVLGLNKSLSDTYWINVNDPGFPFVGVIEHTNLDRVTDFDGLHIVYLSRYLSTSDPMWSMGDKDLLDECIPHLSRMFPEFSSSWIEEFSVWRARYAQPVTVKDYSKIVPSSNSRFPNVFVENMAQVYPEDRGTNYAVRGGLRGAKNVLDFLRISP